MNFVHIVAVLAVIQFVVFSALVGHAREKYGVKAPAVSGHEDFERVWRVQMNTLEQLVCFLPALFIAAQYWPPLFVSLMGLVYLVGRLIYRRAYLLDPSKRTLGFMMTFSPTVILLLASLFGALFRSAA